MNFHVPEEEVIEVFKQSKVNVVKLALLRDGSGRSKGYGYVEFATVEDANYALSSLNGMEIKGRRITLAPQKSNTNANYKQSYY